MLTITHSHKAGTLIDGTTKGDGSAAALKANRWRWSSRLGSWFIPNSRDRFSKQHQINATADALRAAGFEVEVHIDDVPRQAAEVEASRQDRAVDRVEALTEKEERKTSAAKSAGSRVETLRQTLPPFGQPILLDHHSGPGMLRKAEKFHNAKRREIDAQAAADEASSRTQAASKTTEFRHTPSVVANRIKRLTAEAARIQRQLDGHERTLYSVGEIKHTEITDRATGRHKERLELMLQNTHGQLQHWTDVRQQQIDSGQIKNYGPATISPGDRIRSRGAWHEVRRTNPKSVSVPAEYNPAKTETIAYTDITAHIAGSEQ